MSRILFEWTMTFGILGLFAMFFLIMLMSSVM